MAEDVIDDPIASIENTLAFDSRDWSTDKRDAWLWGVVFGWDEAMEQVAKMHKWTPETVERLGQLHRQWVALRQPAKGG